MPFSSPPGVLFIGTLYPPERAYLKPLFAGAALAGYSRFIEPACGVFAMSQMAVVNGWPRTAVETSDVSFLSTVLGYAVMGRDLGELEIDFEDEQCGGDPAEVLWTFDLLRSKRRSGKAAYWSEIERAMRLGREVQVEGLRDQLRALRARLEGLSFRPLDLFEHLAEVLDDPEAFVSLNPPTFAKGYEKFFDTGGKLHWREPSYTVFEPEAGHARLREMVKNARALVVIYSETADPAKLAGKPVFALGGTRQAPGDSMASKSINAYISCNRPAEIEGIVDLQARRRGTALKAPRSPVLPQAYVYSADSQVTVEKIGDSEAMYYRQLWTHNFMGTPSGVNVLVRLDGYAVGVLGLDLSFTTLGLDSVGIIYSIPCSDRRQRWGRLLTRLALSRRVHERVLAPLTAARCQEAWTGMFTRHPESKEHRGLMVQRSREKDAKFGYRLTYSAPLHDRDERACWQETLKDDERWQQKR